MCSDLIGKCQTSLEKIAWGNKPFSLSYRSISDEEKKSFITLIPDETQNTGESEKIDAGEDGDMNDNADAGDSADVGDNGDSPPAEDEVELDEYELHSENGLEGESQALIA